jgi:hypothetical protein
VVLGHSPQISLEHYNRATAVVVAARDGEQIVVRTRRLSSLAAKTTSWASTARSKTWNHLAAGGVHRLSYRIDASTPPMKSNAATCPAQNVSIVSAG